MKSAPYISSILIACAILLPGWWLLGSLPLFIVMLWFIDNGALRYIGGKRFWLWLATGTLILPLLGGGGKVYILGLGYSIDTLIIALRISARGFLIFAGMALIRRQVPPGSIARMLMKIGLRGMSAVVPISFHLVPSLMESTKRTISIWRYRGGMRKHQLKNLLLLLTSLQVQWVREAEELYLALALEEIESGRRIEGKEPEHK